MERPWPANPTTILVVPSIPLSHVLPTHLRTPTLDSSDIYLPCFRLCPEATCRNTPTSVSFQLGPDRNTFTYQSTCFKLSPETAYLIFVILAQKIWSYLFSEKIEAQAQSSQHLHSLNLWAAPSMNIGQTCAVQHSSCLLGTALATWLVCTEVCCDYKIYPHFEALEWNQDYKNISMTFYMYYNDFLYILDVEIVIWGNFGEIYH